MILITGAAGFIGQHLIRSIRSYYIQSNARLEDGTLFTPVIYGLDLKSDPTPVAYDIRDWYQVDIADENAMKKLIEPLRGKVEKIIHLAAVASPPIAQKNPTLAWQTNVQGTHNVLQLAHEIGCKQVVFMSSAHVYGISPKYLPTDEEHPLALHDTYTTTKIVGEKLCDLFYRNHGISYVVLRLWNAYGPSQSPDYFIGCKITQAKTGKLTIRNENVTKDWIHVNDVVRAIYLASQSPYVGPLNVGTGYETKLGTIVARIGNVFNVPLERENVADEGPTRMCADARRIEDVLTWKPRIAFDQGLAALLTESEIPY